MIASTASHAFVWGIRDFFVAMMTVPFGPVTLRAGLRGAHDRFVREALSFSKWAYYMRAY
ncbi:MAG: hypothetical protein ABW043_19710 [Devosia sp.]